jgi:hypothetical protein
VVVLARQAYSEGFFFLPLLASDEPLEDDVSDFVVSDLGASDFADFDSELDSLLLPETSLPEPSFFDLLSAAADFLYESLR